MSTEPAANPYVDAGVAAGTTSTTADLASRLTDWMLAAYPARVRPEGTQYRKTHFDSIRAAVECGTYTSAEIRAGLASLGQAGRPISQAALMYHISITSNRIRNPAAPFGDLPDPWAEREVRGPHLQALLVECLDRDLGEPKGADLTEANLLKVLAGHARVDHTGKVWNTIA